MTQEQKLALIEALHTSLFDKTELYRKKMLRARSIKMVDKWESLWQRYRRTTMRTQRLYWDIKTGARFPEGRNSWEPTPEQYKQRSKEWKAKRKAEFDQKIFVGMWFYSTSFGADYGTFNCHSCGRQFYHSPATLYRGKEKLHECTCGHCVNQTLRNNRQDLVYQ